MAIREIKGQKGWDTAGRASKVPGPEWITLILFPQIALSPCPSQNISANSLGGPGPCLLHTEGPTLVEEILVEGK